MNYTPQQRAEMAEAFKAARKHLPSELFLCLALRGAGAANPRITEACLLASAEVMRRIAPSGTVVRWLIRNGHATDDLCSNYMYALEYRTRWLNSLIAEFSNP